MTVLNLDKENIMDKQKIMAVNGRIDELDDKNKNIFVFADGPIRIDSYCKSEFPIVIILQEPYTDEDKYLKYLSGELQRPNTAEDKTHYSSMDSWLKEEGATSGYKTYLPIVSMVNQIFISNCSYVICKDNDAYEVFLNNVAILNIKKMPNTRVASSSSISSWAKNDKNIEFITSQIDACEPKLVLMANISRKLKSVKSAGNECCIWGNKIKAEHNFITHEGNRVYYNNTTLYIDACHFSRLKNRRKEEVVKMAILWKKGNKDMLANFK